MNDLPKDLLLYIATYLVRDDIVRAIAMVNRHWYNTFKEEVKQANLALESLPPKLRCSFEPYLVSVDSVYHAMDSDKPTCVICNRLYKRSLATFDARLGLYAHSGCLSLNDVFFKEYDASKGQVSIPHQQGLLPRIPGSKSRGGKLVHLVWNGNIGLVPSHSDNRFTKIYQGMAIKNYEYWNIVERQGKRLQDFQGNRLIKAREKRIEKIKKVIKGEVSEFQKYGSTGDYFSSKKVGPTTTLKDLKESNAWAFQTKETFEKYIRETVKQRDEVQDAYAGKRKRMD